MTRDNNIKTGDPASGHAPADRTKKEAESSFMFWLSIGVGLGIVFGVMWDNIGVGIALGAGLGIVLDTALSAVQRRRKGS